MIVCVCQRVSDRDIARHVSAGVSTFDELQMATGAATCCGRCESCARDTLEAALARHVAIQSGWMNVQVVATPDKLTAGSGAEIVEVGAV